MLALQKITNNVTGEVECNNFENGSIYAMYCGRDGIDMDTDPECLFFRDHNATLRPGIPGLSSGMFASKFIKNVVANFFMFD